MHNKFIKVSTTILAWIVYDLFLLAAFLKPKVGVFQTKEFFISMQILIRCPII